MKNLRLHEKVRGRMNHHPDFEFVTAGNENVFIGGWGLPAAGQVHLEPKDYERYSTIADHLFVYCHEEETRHRLKSLEPELRELVIGNDPVKMGKARCNKWMVVHAYQNKYGRDGLE